MLLSSIRGRNGGYCSQNRAQTKTFSAVARRRIFTFQQSIDGKDISLKSRRRVLSSRIPDFPRHVVSGYHQSSCLAAGSLAVFLWIMDKRMEMGRPGAAVTIRMRRVAGETPTLTRLQRVPLPCKHKSSVPLITTTCSITPFSCGVDSLSAPGQGLSKNGQSAARDPTGILASPPSPAAADQTRRARRWRPGR